MNNPLKFVDPSGHGFWSWFKKILGAFIGALVGVLITVATLGAMGVAGVTLGAMLANATLGQAILAGAIGGLIGGAIGGGISGGLKGALYGALFGAVGGALTGAIGYGIGQIKDIALRTVISIGVVGIGAGVSYATGGWQGLATFGAAALGAMAGSGIGGAMRKGSNAYQFKMPRKEIGFDYGKEEAPRFSNTNLKSDTEVINATGPSGSGAAGSVSGETMAVVVDMRQNVDVQLARLAGIGGGIALLEAGGELVIAGVELLGTPTAPLGVASIIVGTLSLGVGFYIIREAGFNYQHYFSEEHP